jgi:hypothetical protein
LNPGHKFGGDAMYAQLSCQNPLTCPITNSDLIRKDLNGSTSILTSELLKDGYIVGRCGADGPTCLLVFLSGPALNRACHSSTRVWLMPFPRTLV